MTEAQWDACTDPMQLLEFVRDKASDRKLRLFAVACCRRLGPLMPEDWSKNWVEVAERNADGALHVDALHDAVRFAGDPGGDPVGAAALACCMPVAPRCTCGADLTLRRGRQLCFFGCSKFPVCRNTQPYWRGIAGAAIGAALATGASDPWPEHHLQCRLIRDIMGNPFLPPPALDPAWLTWNDRIVSRLAQAAYEDRLLPEGKLDLARLSVLADALEEAGCRSADLLNHLRSRGPHVRGCYALDAILGK